MLTVPSAIKISEPICRAKHGLEQVTWQSLSHKQMLIWMLIKIYKPCATVFFFLLFFLFWLHTLRSYLLNIFQVYPLIPD